MDKHQIQQIQQSAKLIIDSCVTLTVFSFIIATDEEGCASPDWNYSLAIYLHKITFLSLSSYNAVRDN